MKNDRYPERYRPYYVPGVGWFWDTRYVDRMKGAAGRGCLWIILIFIVLAAIAGLDNLIGI